MAGFRKRLATPVSNPGIGVIGSGSVFEWLAEEIKKPKRFTDNRSGIC